MNGLKISTPDNQLFAHFMLPGVQRLHVLKLLGKANFKAHLRLTCAVQTSIRNEMQTLMTSKNISRSFYCVSWEAHIYLNHDMSQETHS